MRNNDLWWLGMKFHCSLLPLLLSRFSRVRLCATPLTAAHQAPPCLGFSRQEYWSGSPFLSPVNEREKWKWSRSVMSDSSRPHGLQLTRLLSPWIFQARVLEWGAIAFSGSLLKSFSIWQVLCGLSYLVYSCPGARWETSLPNQRIQTTELKLTSELSS